MSSQRNESLGTDLHFDSRTKQDGNDRSGLFGLMALLSLAFPALGIRYLLPELNPLFLVGLGAAVYGIYLLMLVRHMARPEDVEPQLEPVMVRARDR